MQIIETEKANSRINNSIQIGFIYDKDNNKHYNATVIKYPHYRYIAVTIGKSKEKITKEAINIFNSMP